MKFFLALLTLMHFLTISVQAQKTEIFYDYNWKECAPEYARYYAVIEKKIRCGNEMIILLRR